MIDKIRKLLALANNNTNEEEAASAMSKARELMLKHGIEDKDLIEKSKSGVEYSTITKCQAWEIKTAFAAATLAGVQPLTYPKASSAGFLGRPENNELAQLLWVWINQQVEAFYKAALPRGLTQKERSEFLKSFKWACSNRIIARALKIVQEDKEEHKSFALVLVNEVELKLREDQVPVGKGKVHKMKNRDAAVAGYQAADQVKLSKELEQ